MGEESGEEDRIEEVGGERRRGEERNWPTVTFQEILRLLRFYSPIETVCPQSSSASESDSCLLFECVYFMSIYPSEDFNAH